MTTNDLRGVPASAATDTSTTAENAPTGHTGSGEKTVFGITAPAIPLRIAAGSSVIAGLLHYAAVPEHRAQWWAAAVFFTALAALQIIWAALVWCDGRRSVLCAGALVNAGAVALWVVSRSSGLPFGPEAGDPESIGVLDVASTLAELVTLVAVLLVLRPRQNRSGTA